MRTVEFIRTLIAKGMSFADALDLAEPFEDHAIAALSAVAAELDIGGDRSAKSLRNARYYEARKARKASEKRLNKATELATETTENALIQSPLAHVRDKPLPTEITGNHTTPDDASAPDLDWPGSEKPSRAYLDELESVLRATAAPALHIVATRLFDLSPILRLSKAGKGPPCDLQADVLPTIRARSARAPPGTVKSWDFFTEAICEARDRRLSGAPAQQKINGHERSNPHQQSAKFAARQANLERAFASADIAAGGRFD